MPLSGTRSIYEVQLYSSQSKSNRTLSCICSLNAPFSCWENQIAEKLRINGYLTCRQCLLSHFYECKKKYVGGGRQETFWDDNSRLWNTAPCCGMSNVGDIKTLDKMQNVGYTCHLHRGITRRQAVLGSQWDCSWRHLPSFSGAFRHSE